MFNYERLSASKIEALPSVEKVVEFSPSGLDADSVSKVLSLAVDAKTVAAAAFNGYAEIEGRANFRLVYTDREGVSRGVDYNADFSVRVDGAIEDGDALNSFIDVIEADASMTDKLTLTAVIEVSVNAAKRDEIEALIDAEMCYKTMTGICVPKLIAAKTATIAVDEEISAGDVDGILLLDAHANMKRVAASDDKVLLEGAVYATVTFTENGEIVCRTMEIPFSEEVSAEGVAEGDKVLADVCVKGGKIVLQGVSGDNVIKYEGEAVFRIQVFRERETEVVGDMFMLTNEIELERTSSEYTVFDGCRYFTERVTGTAMLGDNRPAAREIAATPYSTAYVTKAERAEGGLIVEGIVNTDVVYVDENGYNSVRAEVPFSIEIGGDFNEAVRARACATAVSARVKRDRELEISVTLGIAVCEYKTVSLSYIKGVTVGEEKEQNTSALSLYIASEGEELWDVSKALTSTPEDILKQNPNLKTPFKEGDRIIYFRALGA